MILTNGIWNLATASEKGFFHTTELTPIVTVNHLTGIMIALYHDYVYRIFERKLRRISLTIVIISDDLFQLMYRIHLLQRETSFIPSPVVLQSFVYFDRCKFLFIIYKTV